MHDHYKQTFDFFFDIFLSWLDRFAFSVVKPKGTWAIWKTEGSEGACYKEHLGESQLLKLNGKFELTEKYCDLALD